MTERKRTGPLAWIVALVGLGLVACQSTGRRTRMGRHNLRLKSVSGHVRLEAESWDETQKSRSGILDRTEISFREAVMFRLLGFYYHPKLLDFDLRTEFGLEQVDVESTRKVRDRSINEDNLAYDFKTRFFKDLPYSSDIYSYRTETRTRQTFFETTEAIVAESGVNLYARKWFIPTRLHYGRYDYEGRGLDTFSEKRETVILDGQRFGDSSQYQYSLEFNDVNLQSSKQTIEDLNLTASTSHLLGADDQHRLSNSFRWRDQGGSVTSEDRGLTSTYQHHWTEALNTNHSLQYTQSSTGGSETDTLNLTSGFSHQLFQSLTSGASARLGRSTIQQGDIDTIGGNLSLNYRKQTPIGRLTLRYLADGYVQDQGALQGLVSVIDETHVNDPSIPIFLANSAVEHSQVVVSNVTGLIIYTEGTDYVLTRVGSRTRVDIPVTSLIAPGQTILIDYAYAPVPAQKFRSVSQTTGMSLRVLEAADIDVSYSQIDQTLLNGFDVGTLDDSRRTHAGVRVYPFGSTLGAEYEDYESEITPFERVRYYVTHQQPFLGRGTWQVSASTFRTRFKNEAETERGTSASLSLYASLGPGTLAELRSEVRDVEYRTDKGEGYIVELNLKKRFRSLALALTARHSEEEFEVATDQRITSILFSLTRRF